MEKERSGNEARDFDAVDNSIEQILVFPGCCYSLIVVGSVYYNPVQHIVGVADDRKPAAAGLRVQMSVLGISNAR